MAVASTSAAPQSTSARDTNAKKRLPLAKLDELCVWMLASENGLTVKQQKYFRVSVPQAYTGYDLVQWLTERLKLEDNAEAVHLANMLMHYGYIFPVIDPVPVTVKDDNSLFRFQLPYYWVSHVGSVDNVEYAIYLSKRLMRNEEKHGLEAYEVEAYNKLMALLGHMWDFISVQAEMQLKLHKEKKKSDKVVLDSQERAFWRLHRPPQNMTSSCLEQGHCKLEKRLKRKSVPLYEKEVDRLKMALKTKPWLKSPKPSETMVSWCEQFQDYDPFISGCQPSNPWISEDITLWVLNTDTVEVPTERRVKRWGVSVQELVRDPIGRQVLETFLESEFSSENIRFWTAVQQLKYAPISHVTDRLDRIYEEYLAHGAPCQVNVDSRTLVAATNAMTDALLPQRYCFSQAEEHVFTLMSKDSYPRFVRSDIYKGVLSAAQQQGSKRLGWKNFIFNVGGTSGAGKKTNPGGAVGGPALIVPTKPKLSRDDNSQNNIAKQLSSDSLPVVAGQTLKTLGRMEE